MLFAMVCGPACAGPYPVGVLVHVQDHVREGGGLAIHQRQAVVGDGEAAVVAWGRHVVLSQLLVELAGIPPGDLEPPFGAAKSQNLDYKLAAVDLDYGAVVVRVAGAGVNLDHADGGFLLLFHGASPCRVGAGFAFDQGVDGFTVPRSFVDCK
jgi:hypothetical protein